MESKQVGNRSIWSEGRVETRSAGWDRRVCRVKSGAQLRDFPYGSDCTVESITVKNFSRFAHSRPFQKSTFHTCSRNVQERESFSTREWKGGKERSVVSSRSFAILESSSRKYTK